MNLENVASWLPKNEKETKEEYTDNDLLSPKQLKAF